MSVVAWYAVVAGVLFPVGALLLHRMAWPSDPKSRFAAAAALALAWPLAVPMLSFGSVAIARLLRERPPARRKRDAARVAPAA
ncbi:MAG: hypothetical protein ACRDKJ_04435 [Actinomycetota bacterium]